MPAVSKAQRVAMAIAEHEPSKLYVRNKGLKKMTHQQLHDFASTKEKGLPNHHNGKGTRSRLNTAASKLFFNSKQSK